MAHVPQADSEQPQRPAPRLIRVAPPKASIFDAQVLSGLGIAVFWGLVCLSAGVTVTGLIVPAVLLLLCVWALVASARRSVRFNRRQRDFWRHHEGWGQKRVAAALSREWYYSSLPPDVKVVKKVLAREALDYANQPVIVVMGALELPPVEQGSFEPVTLKAPPKESLSTLAAAVTAMIGIWLLFWARGGGALAGESLGLQDIISGAVVLLAACGVGLTVRFFVDRPTLLRLGPATVGVSTCLLRESKRKTRMYPLTGGTLGMITQTPRKQTLTLVRGGHSDTVSLPALQKKTQWGKIWQALLFTGPTPPLTEEELPRSCFITGFRPRWR